jgi:hypothetical protein
VHRLSSLELPPRSDDLTPERALQYSAVQLFNERALAIADGFALDGDDIAPVIEICHRLDGMPLALELAAARVDAFGVKSKCPGQRAGSALSGLPFAGGGKGITRNTAHLAIVKPGTAIVCVDELGERLPRRLPTPPERSSRITNAMSGSPSLPSVAWRG